MDHKRHPLPANEPSSSTSNKRPRLLHQAEDDFDSPLRPDNWVFGTLSSWSPAREDNGELPASLAEFVLCLESSSDETSERLCCMLDGEDWDAQNEFLDEMVRCHRGVTKIRLFLVGSQPDLRQAGSRTGLFGEGIMAVVDGKLLKLGCFAHYSEIAPIPGRPFPTLPKRDLDQPRRLHSPPILPPPLPANPSLIQHLINEVARLSSELVTQKADLEQQKALIQKLLARPVTPQPPRLESARPTTSCTVSSSTPAPIPGFSHSVKDGSITYESITRLSRSSRILTEFYLTTRSCIGIAFDIEKVTFISAENRLRFKLRDLAGTELPVVLYSRQTDSINNLPSMLKEGEPLLLRDVQLVQFTPRETGVSTIMLRGSASKPWSWTIYHPDRAFVSWPRNSFPPSGAVMQFCERLLREAGRGEARSGELDAYRPKPQPARSDPLLSGPSVAAEPGQGSRNMGSGGQRPVLKLKDLQAPSYVDLVVQVVKVLSFESYSNSRVTLHVTDFTENSNLPPGPARHPPLYSTTSSSFHTPTEPFGEYTLELTIWETDASVLPGQGEIVRLEDVEIKLLSEDRMVGIMRRVNSGSVSGSAKSRSRGGRVTVLEQGDQAREELTRRRTEYYTEIEREVAAEKSGKRPQAGVNSGVGWFD